jgi:predicted RNase H-like HicB family nuclease
MNITFETELEADGRWIAEVPELLGVMAYGASETEAVARAEALALRVLADRIDHNESGAVPVSIMIAAE